MSKKHPISLLQAFIPVVILVGLLAFNVLYVYGDDALSGANQFVLLIGGFVAALVGFYNKITYKEMISYVAENIKSVTGAILILLFVGALSGTWLLSGVIPSMIYYGIKILNPLIFLPLTVIVCAVISLATGSSWTTSATVGIALIGIGKAIGLPVGMVAGAVISGAYFGDKLSPLSDTTNLAPAMSGTDLFTHIRYMTLTTVPTVIVTLIIFTILGFTTETTGQTDTKLLLVSIEKAFHISPWLFLVPAVVIFMIVRKTEPLIALFVGTLLGAIFAIIFQKEVLLQVSGGNVLDVKNAYQAVIDAITRDVAVQTDMEALNDLFSSGGMYGMLNTIWLIICAMVFGGIMEAIGALNVISEALLKLFNTVFGLFASTVVSCLMINVTASDQYLAIVVPGKMFKKAYKDKGLAPENLSRTLEDSGTVTSVLVPWNTCGAYQSKVLLGEAGMMSYIPYAFFNYLSPFVTLLYAALNLKIKQLKK